jgi:hypothetical protein
MKGTDLRDMVKAASKSICTSTVAVSPDPLSPTPSNFSAIKTPENTEEGPEPADEKDIHDTLL